MHPSQRSVAVIGSGVSGLVAAYVLALRDRVTLYEADTRLGGHAHTHQIQRDDGDIVAEIPAEYYTGACPTYVREAVELQEVVSARATDPRRHPDLTPGEFASTLMALLASPNIGSRRPVYEQYDHTIQTNTVVPPGVADAAVLRIKASTLGIAAAIDCNPRYCYLEPYLGAQLAATLRAAERLQDLARRYGTEEIIGAMAEVMDYSERLMRASLADLPDGEGTFEDFCDGDGIADDAQGRDAPFWIRMAVKKTGDRLLVDFAGSDPMASS